jgi:hypothetical protein
MPNLTYWVAKINDDHRCYNIRTKTKKECLALVAASVGDGGKWASRFETPKKVTVSYADGFDLMDMCLNEGGGFWE